jgi:hypothetical protein
MFHRIAVVLVLMAFSAVAEAGGPRLKLPSFSHLESQAVESVDITFGRMALGLAGWFIDKDDPDSAQARQMLKSIKSMSVCHYRFDSDFVYATKDLDAVRSQLSGDGWSPLVQVRDRRKDEDVDVFLSLDGDKITGVAIIASEPREFTILNIVGTLDMDQVERWAAQARSGKDRLWADHKTQPEHEHLADASSPEL